MILSFAAAALNISINGINTWSYNYEKTIQKSSFLTNPKEEQEMHEKMQTIPQHPAKQYQVPSTYSNQPYFSRVERFNWHQYDKETLHGQPRHQQDQCDLYLIQEESSEYSSEHKITD